MRLSPVRVARSFLLSLAILSCAPERAVSPTMTPLAVDINASALSASSIVVISQVYGGGGNSGATYNKDYIELFNRGTAEVSLAGLSLQYASATGTGNFGSSATQLTPLSGTILPGKYVLVEEAGGSTGGSLVGDQSDPTPINMAAGAGKVALVTGTTTLGCNGGSAPCNAAALARILDLVGYGNANFFEGTATAPTISSSLAAFRKNRGCVDTDQNSHDFAALLPVPRNHDTPPVDCSVLSDITMVSVRVSWVTPGTSFRVTAAAFDKDGNPIDTEFDWSVTPASIATVDPATGDATGVSPGVAAITATASNGVSGTAPLFVVAPGDVATVSVAINDPAQVPLGFTKPAFPTSRTTANVVVTPTLTWSSSDESIATVSELGYITGIAVGTVRIRATAPDGVYGEAPFTVIPATAATSAVYRNHVEFGVPTDNTPADELILTKPQYVESYNAARGGPNWVSWDINASQFGAAPRCDCFSADQTLPAGVYHVVDFDYRNGGYDRGHMVQSESRTTTDQENASTFLLTNILPQGAENNQGPWSKFENYLNDLARGTTADPTRHEIYVVAGGRYASTPITLKGEGKVAIPDYTWKIAVVMPEGRGIVDVHSTADINVIAVEMPNLTTTGVPASSVGIRDNPWQNYMTRVDDIEAETGYDLLSALPDAIERLVESGDRPPVAMWSGPTTAAEGASVTFDATASSDPDGDVLTYLWDFGDGTTGTSATPAHTYADNGSYTVTLTVKDPVGAEDFRSNAIVISNAAPIVRTLTTTASVVSGETVFALGTFSDAGTTDSPWSYVFDWGGGSTSTGSTSDQTGSLGSSRSFLAAGSYSVSLTVTDKDGATSLTKVATFQVGRIPTALAVYPERVNLVGGGNGQLVVTVFGTPSIDAAAIDLRSVRIGTTSIDDNGDAALKSALRDANNDGVVDLIVHFDRNDLVRGGQLTGGTTEFLLQATLSDGREIEARGSVNVGSKR
jgi:DNA/RNA endonuclease G (NUC1)